MKTAFFDSLMGYGYALGLVTALIALAALGLFSKKHDRTLPGATLVYCIAVAVVTWMTLLVVGVMTSSMQTSFVVASIVAIATILGSLKLAKRDWSQA